MTLPPDTPDDIFDGVERAIDKLAGGDVHGAASEYRRLVARAPSAPEVIVLEGMLASRGGAPEEALRAYERAASVDPEYALPLVLAAETCLMDLQNPERCLEFCAIASRIGGNDDSLAEIMLLEADAFSELDKHAEVRKRIARLADLSLSDSVLCQRAGDLALEFEDLKRAQAFFTHAVDLDPNTADAWHGLGLVHEAEGSRKQMIDAWLKTYQLDAADSPRPWHMSHRDFEREVEDALVELPKVIRDKLANVAVLVEDAPSEDLIREGTDPRLLGLFTGTPTTERGTLDGVVADPDTIQLFQRNIEAAVEDSDQLHDEIRITLIHETAHYFGLEDDDLEELGLG